MPFCKRRPGRLHKEGPAYDLSIAVGILLASEQVGADLSEAGLVGELSLDGQVRGVTGRPVVLKRSILLRGQSRAAARNMQ